MKQKPKWVETRERLNQLGQEPVVFIGKMGVAGVIDGKLPNGEVYHRNIRKKR